MKKLLLSIAALIALVIVALLALILFVNPNQFKPMIVEQVQKNTGMTLAIEGDISWQFFPSLGFSVGKTELRNPEGFSSPNLLKVEQVGLAIEVTPLLSNQLVIGNILLDGAEVSLETLKDGTSNLDSLTKASSAKDQAETTDTTQAPAEEAPAETGEQPSALEQWEVLVAGITISNAKVTVSDKQAGTLLTLSDANASLTEFEFGQWSKLTFDVTGAQNQQNFAAEGQVEFKLSQDLKQYELREVALDASVDDKSLGLSAKAKLSLPAFALGAWNSIEFDVSGKNQQQNFAAKGGTEFFLSEDFQDYQLRKLGLDASFSDPANKVEKLRLDLASFAFDKQNALSYELLGDLAGLAVDSKGSLNITVDKAISKIKVASIKLANNLKGEALPQSPMAVNLDAGLTFDVKKSALSLVLNKLTANDIALDGKASVVLAAVPQVNFDLHSPNIDLDTFLGLNQKAEAETDQSTGGESGSAPTGDAPKAPEVEPDLSALKLVNAKGKVVIDKFKANNAKLQKVTTQFTLKNGVFDLTRFSANLYQGSISTKAKLDARKATPTYSVNGLIKGVKVQPLLVDVAETDLLEGTGNIDLALTGKSLKPTALQENLKGTVKINFADGAVYGVNLPHLIRTHYARFKGQDVSAADTVEKTDFSAMTATLKLNQGVVTTDNLNMQSPLLRITGKGNANYIKQDVDMVIRTSIVGSLKGQGGESIDDLKDVTIPVQISGKWTDPKYKLVFDDVLKQKAKKEAEKGLQKLLGDKVKPDQTKDIADKLLKGLFN
ncbi:putative AsmA protein [Vibrio nigripulchritudo MADA3029]|nr:AsmA family protein [Vibrio nigripulchritudo]CCN48300.1 putative AsmA protein [Vibrio nigripulchritudo MADA3020]CCN54922.1 putative AsmA protein [Vibrio nigripulchritudo MADA3021]CCN58203.1 putative AsmA protein [Vibrio nigripulchritudo MADA3029]